MASIFDVARHILENNDNISKKKVEILCYYCQAYSLWKCSTPLFEEDFYVGGTAPYTNELFWTTIELTKDKDLDTLGCCDNLSEEEKRLIDIVVDRYKFEGIKSRKYYIPWPELKLGDLISKEKIKWFYFSML